MGGGLIGFLLGTNRVVVTEGSTWELAFATGWSVAWFVLIAVLVAAGVITLYLRESVPLTARQRAFFVTMRMLIVITLLVMLAEPSIFVSTESEARSVVAVLVDTSESMGVRDAYHDDDLQHRAARTAGILPADAAPAVALTDDQIQRLHELNRHDFVRAALTDADVQFLERLAEGYDVEVYAFDASARRVAADEQAAPDAAPEGAVAPVVRLDPADIEPTGKSTDVGAAIRAAIKDARSRKRTLAAVVVLSDGRITGSAESISAIARYAGQRGVPVHAVAVGDPSQPRDVRISALLLNNTVFVDDPTQAGFVIESTGFEGRRVRVELLRGDRLVTGKDVLLEGDGRQQRVTFNFKPHTPGKHTYTVQVRPLSGELIEANNSVSALVSVIKGKIKVLYVEGVPRWEYRTLKTSLIRDESLEVSCLLSSAEYGFIQEGNLPLDHFPSKPDELFKYNVVILGDVDPTIFTPTQLKLMKEFVERMGGGMVFSAGEKFMPRTYRSTELGSMIPVVYDTGRYVGANRTPKGLTRAFLPQLTEAGKEHPIMLLADKPDESERLWRRLPGLYWYFPVRRAKPGATTLLEHPSARSEGKPRPLVATGFYGAGRVVFVGIDSTWRWRYGVEDKYFYRFWGQMIRYLNAGRQLGLGQRYRITTYKPEYIVGEEIIIRARILDRAYRPVAMKDVEATVVMPGGQEAKVALKPAGEGAYEGHTRALKPGTHEVRLTNPRPEVEGEKAVYNFLVKRPDIEFRNTCADHTALLGLARTTAGRFYQIDQLRDVANDLRREKRVRIDRAQFPLWDAPIFFIVFFLAICAEWVYRKRQRLL